MPSRQIGRGIIHRGNALDLMHRMEPDSVSMIFTDPPYKITSGGKYKPIMDDGSNNKHKAGWHNTALKHNDGTGGFKHNNLHPRQYMYLLYRVLKPGSHCYVMTNSLTLEVLLTEARKAGFGFHNLLIWHKDNKIVNRWYMKETELVCFFYKRPAKAINRPGSSQIKPVPNIPGKSRIHPTQKPLALIKHYIRNSSDVGGLVFDPFAGSGSTAVAAQQCGRRWITCEIDPEYADIAVANILSSCRSMVRRSSK